ncbi:MAG: peptidoglycan DD-metalloendopeptidase family protein [Clostridia bacterium]|nr:peptidoglycan DD-metalloendopeptidase family protein [Clostridia bacterium]
MQSYEQQLAEISKRQQEALNNLQQVRNEQASAMEQKAAYDSLVDLAVKKKELAKKQYDSIVEQIASKEEMIATATVNIETKYQAFLDRMVTVYEEGEVSYLELILGAQSLTDFFNRIDTVNTIREYDKRVIESLKQNKADLEEAQLALVESLALQETTMKQYEQSIADAQKISDEALAYMQSLENDEAKWLDKYYENLALEKELDAQLQQYLKELAEKNKSNYVGGVMGWPLPLDVKYYVSSEQGWRKLWGMDDYHYGIDLACAANTEIYAANAGEVVTSTYHNSYGNYVLIDHGGGKATLYAHMNQRLVNVGDKVEKGQLIGKVGSTGNSSGNHLHFEVRENGEVQNPRNYINLP